MKKRHYFIINALFLGLMTFSALMVIQFMTGYKPMEAIAGIWGKHEVEHVQTEACSDKLPLQNLSSTDVSSLKKLSVYQQACHSFATDTVMVFFSMAADKDQARRYAIEDAKTLKAFKQANIRPLVMIEPADKNGKLLDFKLFANGSYDFATDAYFAQLKSEGITSADLGIINPFPEANLPYWKNNQAKYFSPAVNRYLTTSRKYFAKVETSVLLNSATYELDDFNWENGDYNSLLPYVKDIQPGLITYAGLQGFPWVARQGGNATIFNAAEFLNPLLLQEMADELQTKKVWYNTGTFSSKYTLDAKERRKITPSQRKEILMTIRSQAELMKSKGYEVAVNIFAEDKSDSSEETDWSYWEGEDPFTSQDTVLLTTFIRDLNTNGIDFWLFDK